MTFGFEAPAERADEYFAARLFADMLGGGASSRLFHEVREERGLAYSVSANVHPFADTGPVLRPRRDLAARGRRRRRN